jgi:hypothetical protein
MKTFNAARSDAVAGTRTVAPLDVAPFDSVAYSSSNSGVLR